MFLLHNDLPSVISMHRRWRFVCMIPMNWLLTLNRSLFQLFCLVCCLLTRQGFVPRQLHMCPWCYIDCLIPVRWLLTLNRSLFRFFLSGTVCWLDIDLLNISSTCTLGLSCSITLVQWLLTLNNSSFYTLIFHLGTVYLHHFR